MKKLKPCACGNDNLIFWEPCESDDRVEQLTRIEKIECLSCGKIVYGADDDSVEDWNNHRYDN